MKIRGAVAAGHPDTVAAATAVLEEGGNAFDAALAALCAACVAEPVLTSLGGGGFLLARPAGADPVVYDFFVHTPKRRPPVDELDFFPIVADFGTAQQEFHIGLGSIATPGTVRGLFTVHRELGSMPMRRIVEPAMALAQDGVVINQLQAYIFDVVGKIYIANEACRARFGSAADPMTLIGEGETFVLPEFADVLDALAREGDDLFYRGEIAARIDADCRTGGGTLTGEDLAAYQVVKRVPLTRPYRDTQLHTNPPPSTGGILIAFALDLLRDANLGGAPFGSLAGLVPLAKAMAATNKARLDQRLGEGGTVDFLDPGFVDLYRHQIVGRPSALRGTTHISVIDGAGNAAGLSLSNGEGSSYLVPETGIMLNNMLGEEDLNPGGFHQWAEDTRICSMMAPTLIEEASGILTIMGSGGSNRIRTAILQVLINLLEHDMRIETAVTSPRIHVEGGTLSAEDGFDGTDLEMAADGDTVEAWDGVNLFFGGVHAVRHDPARGHYSGAGDPRRGGVSSIL
jgi:gamma-glutamyltranspeptidase / glutathione hydrolase